jgi:hypothetical protein
MSWTNPYKRQRKIFAYDDDDDYLPNIIVTFQNFLLHFFLKASNEIEVDNFGITHHKMIYYCSELALNDNKNFTLTCNLSPPSDPIPSPQLNEGNYLFP